MHSGRHVRPARRHSRDGGKGRGGIGALYRPAGQHRAQLRARDEIVRAVNLAVSRGERVTKESFASLLYTGGQPDPDLIIRTGKERRLSNFLLYQAAYSELYFSDKMFPAFSDRDFDAALKDYAARDRRFGKV